MLTFLKAQAASLAASIADILITVTLVELAGIAPVQASVEGLISGGIINFTINRVWVFNPTQNRTYIQAMRYLLVWTGNVLLNAAGLYLLTRFTTINYAISKILVSMLVGVFYNYFMQKRFVFK